MTRLRLFALALGLALSACGSEQELKPVPGQPLPPTPYARTEPQSADELLKPDTQAVPSRNEELRQRSEERADDPFDLPPTS